MRKSFQLVTLVLLLLVLMSCTLVTAAPPNTPPKVTIDSPADGATVSGTVTISVTVTDRQDRPAPVSDIYIDGKFIIKANTYEWDTTTYSDGSHTVYAEATDSGGLTGSDTNTVTVKNAAPPPPPSFLTSISWFGAHSRDLCVHGLWTRCYRSMLDQMWSLGFNSLRLPYCNDMIHATSPVKANTINELLGYNYELDGLLPIEVFDEIVDYAYSLGFAIILDRHCTKGETYAELWYDGFYSETEWINDWKFLVGRYGSKIWGVDLHNEPHGSATWGSGDLSTDWRLAAERCGEAILSVNPNVYIIVEGVQYYDGYQYWWGGNLMGVRDYPVRLNNVMYSPHDYGPDLSSQTWFNDPNFPSNLPAVWDQYWGYIEKENLGRLWLGEFGTEDTSTTTKQGQWYNTLLGYMDTNGIEFAYWSFNANERNGYGILTSDWSTVDQGTTTNKWGTLKPYLQGDTSNPILYADP